MKKLMTMCVVIAALAVPVMAETTVVTSGDIYALYPTAKEYGAVRFKDFTNTKDGNRGQNLYMQNNSSSLGSPTGSDGRARVQGDPWWTVGGNANNFWFEYRPVAGATDLILSGATDMVLNKIGTGTPWDPTRPDGDLRFSRVINDPVKPVNFISFYIQSNEGAQATEDKITVNLTDLDGNTLTPESGSLAFGYLPGGVAKWYLTDPTLLANGFILSGNMVFTGAIEGKEGDKVQIAFGNSTPAVPAPGAILLGGMGVSLVGWLRRRRSL